MKLFKLLFLGACFLGLSNFAHAQIKAGGGLSLGTDANGGDLGVGVHLRGVYEINPEWRGALDLNFFFVDDPLSFWDLNTNANYVFLNNETSMLYALAGLNIATVKVSLDLGPFGGNVSESATEVGLNIGGGGELVLSDQINGFGEIRYVLGDADQLVLTAGILYKFK